MGSFLLVAIVPNVVAQAVDMALCAENWWVSVHQNTKTKLILIKFSLDVRGSTI